MPDRGQLHHSLSGLKKIKTWQLVVLLILSGFVSATLLRLNNVGMVERRNAVLSADEQGDASAIAERLTELQNYVSSHMNTSLGQGVYLEKTYSRALEEWQSDQYGESNPNGNIFVKAQEVCAPQFSSWSTAYVQCVSDELAKYPAADEFLDETSKPRYETYVYSFVSPVWTPDFAGWSVLLTVVIALAIVIRLAILGILNLMLKKHYNAIRY